VVKAVLFSTVCLCAEVANLQSWLEKHLAWMDGALAQQQSTAAPAGRR
jgi:hypothetical protein